MTGGGGGGDVNFVSNLRDVIYELPLREIFYHNINFYRVVHHAVVQVVLVHLLTEVIPVLNLHQVQPKRQLKRPQRQIHRPPTKDKNMLFIHTQCKN